MELGVMTELLDGRAMKTRGQRAHARDLSKKAVPCGSQREVSSRVTIRCPSCWCGAAATALLRKTWDPNGGAGTAGWTPPGC